MDDKKLEIKKITVEGLCELIKDDKVSLGDRFLVARDIKNYHYFSHEEIIYNVFNKHSADTMVKQENYEDTQGRVPEDTQGRVPEDTQGRVPEFRYMAGGHAITLDAFLLTSKDYHKLLNLK